MTAVRLASAAIARFYDGVDQGPEDSPRSEASRFSRVAVSSYGIFWGGSASIVRGAVRLVCWASEATKYRTSVNASDG